MFPRLLTQVPLFLLQILRPRRRRRLQACPFRLPGPRQGSPSGQGGLLRGLCRHPGQGTSLLGQELRNGDRQRLVRPERNLLRAEAVQGSQLLCPCGFARKGRVRP